ATAYLFTIIPKGFIPTQDTGTIQATTEFMQGIGYDSMVEHQQKVAEIVKNDPNVQTFTSNVGGNGSRLSIDLKPLKPEGPRTLTADDVINELRPKLNAVPGVRAYLTNPPAIRIGGQMTRSQYQYTLTSSGDTAELFKAATALEAQMRTMHTIVD